MHLPPDRHRRIWASGYELHADRCGTTNDCTLRFVAANDSPAVLDPCLTVGHAAADGTSVTTTRRGRYAARVVLSLTAHADTTIVAGISKNGTVLNADPVYNAAFANGFLPGSIVESTIPAAAAVVQSLVSSVEFVVTEAEAGAGAIIRFHGGDADGSPTANAFGTLALCSYLVEYLGEAIA